ncbi:MAG: hypothetical protein KJO97_07765, partial [Acidimicrobiia bacterium]|nr:hypothetical protein [Acidimicrobiia bacterium]
NQVCYEVLTRQTAVPTNLELIGPLWQPLNVNNHVILQYPDGSWLVYGCETVDHSVVSALQTNTESFGMVLRYGYSGASLSSPLLGPEHPSRTITWLGGWGDGHDVEVDPFFGYAYVSVPRDNEVVVVDLVTSEVVHTYQFADHPYEVELSDDYLRLYVTIRGARLAVVDLLTDAVVVHNLTVLPDTTDITDVIETAPGVVLLSARVGTNHTRLFEYHPATWIGTPIGGEFYAAGAFLEDPLGTSLYYYRTGMYSPARLYKLDLADLGDPNAPWIDINTSSRPVISPDGQRIYAGTHMYRSSDLGWTGSMPVGGMPIMSDDGAKLYIYSGEIHVLDPITLQLRGTYTHRCDIYPSSPETGEAFFNGTLLVVVVDSNLCTLAWPAMAPS